jgi:ribosomal protein S18 acetylase RimI-like enzyme
MVWPAKLDETAAYAMPLASTKFKPSRVELLTDSAEAEVMDFLSARPIHTVMMTGFIRDNGLESPFNRGAFYGCRNADGQLEGVALIGHVILVEVRAIGALKAFARLAQCYSRAHMTMGEQERVASFWSYYAEGGLAPRRLCRELLFELHWVEGDHQTVNGLRHATLDDLHLVMPVHAEMAQAESGINPLEADPSGFRLRVARRIEQGRVWVWVEEGRLIFKADVISDTPEVNYLEGVYVNPADRDKGHGLRCISHLSRTLLARTKALCLLVNEENQEAVSLFYKAGYKVTSYYDTIFLQQK